MEMVARGCTNGGFDCISGPVYLNYRITLE